MPTHRLTKSRFMAWLHCPRRAWLQVNRPEARGPLTAAEQARIETGIAFGREVTRLFADGVRIEADRGSPEAALAETARHLDRGEAAALFEPAFRLGDVLVRADVLARRGAGVDRWELVEVKSDSNSAGNDPERSRKLTKHWSDMAVQLWVVQGAGVVIDRVSLAWVNAGYERRGEIDWRGLVAIEDHTEAVRERAAGIDEEVQEALDLIDAPEMPPAEFGKTKCVDKCEFADHCWGDEPADSIIHLPRAREAQLADLRARGITRISEIPDHVELPRTQAAAREALRHPDVVVADPAALADWIATLRYPLYYLDFETWNPCIPPFDGVRPYMQIPFQYSLHVQDQPGAEPIHHEFLAPAEGDPRPALTERLAHHIGPAGSIVVHHKSFEKRCLEHLARFSPEHRGALEAMIDRLVDTEDPFSNHWILHPALLGRSSIKVVLPALVPELGYEDLEIADGMTAAIRFGEMYEGKVSGAEVRRVREGLRAYCRRDTEAMVKVVGRLREVGCQGMGD